MIADRKCGTCRSFRVRPNEVGLAQHAKPAGYCGPGRYCHGGRVRGWCAKLGRQADSVDLPCAEAGYEPGGPGIRVVGEQEAAVGGSAARVGYSNPQDLADTAMEALTTDGNILAFAFTGALALGSALLGDWKWREQDLGSLPRIKDQEGLDYPYSLVEGGRRVAIYLPSGRIVEHRVTASAARNPQQLADEVYAVVLDTYQSQG